MAPILRGLVSLDTRSTDTAASTDHAAKIAKLMGHAQFYGGFDFYDADESVASHFFASFDPDVKGERRGHVHSA
jgi:hypothetical protein